MSIHSESSQYLVLLALADGNKNGLDVQRQIVGDTLGKYLPTNRALRGLKEIGLVDMDVWRSQKVYRITEKGRHSLEMAPKEKRKTYKLAQQRLGFL